MVLRIRRRLAAEEGMTLVEMLVAFGILMVISSALAATLVTSLRAVVANEARLRGHQLANEVLEEMRGLSWNQVGFYAADIAALGADEFEGEAYVSIPDPEGGDVPDPRVPTPVFGVERDGRDYGVELHITWVDDPQTSDDQDFKRFTVLVSWDDGGRTVRNAAVRAPTPEEKEPSAFAIRQWFVDPDIAYIDDDGFVKQKLHPDGSTSGVTEVALTVTTTAPVASVKASYSGRDGNEALPITLQPDADKLEWTATVSIGQYRNGDTQFTFVAEDPDRYPGQQAEAVKVVRYVHFDVAFEDGPTVLGDGSAVDYVCLDGGDAALQERVVRASIKGMSHDDLVEVSGANLSAEDAVYAGHVESTVSGSVYEMVIPAGHVYPSGAGVVEILMDPERAVDGATVGGDPDPRLSPPLSLIRPNAEGDYDDPRCQ